MRDARRTDVHLKAYLTQALLVLPLGGAASGRLYLLFQDVEFRFQFALRGKKTKRYRTPSCKARTRVQIFLLCSFGNDSISAIRSREDLLNSRDFVRRETAQIERSWRGRGKMGNDSGTLRRQIGGHFHAPAIGESWRGGFDVTLTSLRPLSLY